MTASAMSDRFRRAIQSDDLTTAKRIFDRMTTQSEVASGSSSHGNNIKFDIRNQASQPNSIHDLSSSHSFGHTYGQNHHYHQGNDANSMHSTEALGNCLALSAAQFNTAKQSRVRERNRESVRIKSSLAIAVENGASIELIQWLLEMGHERGDFSRDIRGCTAVSLAAQNNRTDVIEACCIDAVAHAATLHHQRSLMYYGFRNNMNAYYEDGDDELEGDDRNSNASAEGDRSEGDLSPALTLVTAAASTPSRRPSPSPLYLARTDRIMDGKEMKEETLKADHEGDDAKSSAGGSSEMDDIVGVTITRLLDCPDELGRTALSLASMKGHEDVVRLLLELGATLDLGDFEGNRPLHYASAYNQLIVVQLLIERGCTFAAKNVLGFTAADYAWNASLKSALEAFARAQFDVQRVRIRRKGGGRNEDSPPYLRQQTQQSNGKAGNAPSQHDHTHSEKAKAAQSPSISKSLGLFPAQLPHSSPDTSLPSSPQPPSQPKLTTHLRELF
ncbi:ankyrin [Meira miltonrushii]|uniref:Ankyrin n=1 Tax=Meira miltonrushii TaxID=1280837 RepID=A0A316VGJ5_9BASI|nr:ankyrin [Meira miltonrushii]PWN36712.1 ankyrin [Meira miltonrushii]